MEAMATLDAAWMRTLRISTTRVQRGRTTRATV
jgi:hypothetical protein